MLRDIIRAFNWRIAACLFVAGVLLGGFIVWRIDAPAFRRLRAQIASLTQSQVVEAPTWWFNQPGPRVEVKVKEYRTDPQLIAELDKYRAEAASWRDYAGFLEMILRQKDTLPGNVGVIADSAVADSMVRGWSLKRVQMTRRGRVQWLAFQAPAILKAGEYDPKGSRSWSLYGAPEGIVGNRARRFLGADWRAFAGISAASNYDTFAPSIAGEVGVGIDRGPWGVEVGYSQPTFPLRKGKVTAKMTVNWR